MRFDTIIVGGGTAGTILAARLSEDASRSVLLIEAGPDYPSTADTPDDIRFDPITASWRALQHAGEAAGSFDPRAAGGRAGHLVASQGSHMRYYMARSTPLSPKMMVSAGRVMGGGSAINGQVFVRGMPEDYDLWAAGGNPRWSYDEVLPYFRRVENDLDFRDAYHGSEGPIPVRRYAPEEWLDSQRAYRDACLAAGFPECPDLNHPQATGIGPIPFNNVGGVRYSTALTYLAAARGRANLRLTPQTNVQRIRFNGAKATGVEIARGDTVDVIEADEIIVSAGAIGSPHLLMLSGIGPAADLAALGIGAVVDLPGVGKNLHDHSSIGLRWTARTAQRLPEQPVHTHQLTLAYTSSPEHGRNDIRMRCQSFYLAPDRNGVNRFVTGALGIRTTLQSAYSIGELRLASNDPAADPILDYRHLDAAADRSRLRDAVRLALELATSEPLLGMLAERVSPTDDELRSDADIDNWLLRTVGTADHISGTCKMGPASDPLAVVGQDGRVHGLDNVRVVDASIIPNAIRANLNATTMMLAERISDLI